VAVAEGILPEGWALDDGVAALFTDGRLADVVSRRPGATLHQVNNVNGTAQDIAHLATLLTVSTPGA